MGALAALAVIVFLWLGSREDTTEIVRRDGPVQFNLRYTSGLERVSPQGGEYVHLEARRGDLFIQSFVVSPLELPPYRGEASGVLPLLAPAEIAALRGRFSRFELVQDGKTRVNEAPGYSILFKARLGRRRLYGRSVMLPEPGPGARDGVRLLLLATPAGGVSRATDVGVRGVVKRPYRTFRFGTERP
jgi:hypothetical protein